LNGMIEIRTALDSDLPGIQGIDGLMISDKSRGSFVTKSIQKRECAVCSLDGKLAGYVIFNRDFFDQMFIWILFVSINFRRMGVGTSLIRHVESKCDSASKLFTSTNQSNKVMQNLMSKLGFSKTGYMENLDEGDPELFYFKKIRSSAQK
jgi:ribosomal protein S18 acetylase RimI-like enzyme